MLRASEPVAVSIYGIVSLLAGIACLLLPIETKGRSMQVHLLEIRKVLTNADIFMAK